MRHLLEIVCLRLWHPTEPTRIELLSMVLLSLMMLLMLLESRIVKAVGLIHDDLVITIALIRVVQSSIPRICRIVCYIRIPIRATVDSYLLLGLLSLMINTQIMSLRWRLSLGESATLNPTRTEIAPIRQILKARIRTLLLLLLLLILCHVLDIYRRGALFCFRV